MTALTMQKPERSQTADHTKAWLVDSVKVLRHTRYKIGHFGNVLPSQKKPNLT